jgi:periplasmic protein CpxP/Spy
MKKIIIALVLGMGMSCFAQEATPKSNRGDMQNMTPEQRVEKQLATMTKDLNLDAKQQEAVGTLLKEKSVKAQEVRSKREAQKSSGQKMTDEQRNAFRTAMQIERADTETKLKTILTADQYKKWSATRAENEDRMRQRRGENDFGGGGNDNGGGNNDGGGFGGNDNNGNN